MLDSSHEISVLVSNRTQLIFLVAAGSRYVPDNTEIWSQFIAKGVRWTQTVESLTSACPWSRLVNWPLLYFHFSVDLAPTSVRPEWIWKFDRDDRCGASWAFSTLAVASDRLAIQSSGKEVISLSVQNLLACNNRGQQGCNGGHLDRAWNYMKRIG